MLRIIHIMEIWSCLLVGLTEARWPREIDYSMFVLNVDLWDESGSQEVNLCRQPSSTGAPSIAATSSYTYAAINGGEPPPPQYSSPAVQQSRDVGYGQPSPVGYVQDYHGQQGYNHGSFGLVIDAIVSLLTCQPLPRHPTHLMVPMALRSNSSHSIRPQA
jgi:hypothetical protein